LVTLDPGEVLFEEQMLDRGLFFIEEGVLKIQRSTDYTMTRANESINRYYNGHHHPALPYPLSLSGLKARSETVGQRMKGGWQSRNAMHAFRVARIGAGWILGMNEFQSGMEMTGAIIAGKLFHFVRFFRRFSNPLFFIVFAAPISPLQWIIADSITSHSSNWNHWKKKTPFWY